MSSGMPSQAEVDSDAMSSGPARPMGSNRTSADAAPASAAQPARLSLYHMAGCGYCSTVVETVRTLGLDVELLDVARDRERKAELIEARGRGTVPVLCVAAEGQDRQWIPESRDIVRYLKQAAGAPDETPRWFDRVRDLWAILPWGVFLIGLVMPPTIRPFVVGAALATLGVRGIARGRRIGTTNDTILGGIALACSVCVVVHALLFGQ